MLIQGLVQPPPAQSMPDSMNPVAVIQGKQGELIVSEMGGKYFTQCYRGNLYEYATPLAGVTLGTSGATTQTFGIFNPAGSNKLIVPTKARAAVVEGTPTVSSLVWTVSTGMGTGVAGTSPLQTATFVTTTLNGRSDVLGNNSVARVITTCLLTTAPVVKRYFGSTWGAPIATTASVFPSLIDDFDGDTVVGPGTIFFLSCTLAPAGTTDVSLTWEEVPA